MVEKPSEIMMKSVIPENLANQKDGTLFNPFQHIVSTLFLFRNQYNLIFNTVLYSPNQ